MTPLFLYIFITIFFSFGFYYLGKLTCDFFKINKLILLISMPQFQYASIGISTILLILYPLVFLDLINIFFLKFLSYLILIIGIIFSFLNIKKFNFFFLKLFKLARYNIYYQYVLLLVTLYLLLSLSPITDSDSLAYHLNIGKFILNNGNFPFQTHTYSNALAGAGELLISLSLFVKAEQFGSFVNFIGLVSIIGIIINFSKNININFSLLNLLLVLSCPILVFLLSSAKPQFFYVSLTAIGYAYLLKIKINRYFKSNILKIYSIVSLLLILAINAKINFTLSYVIINFGFFYIFKKEFKVISYFFIINIIFLSLFLMPILIQKSLIYNYSFYNFLINPLPLNIPGFNYYYSLAKIYGSENFPLFLLIPKSIGDITNTFGLGFLIFVIIFLKKSKFSFLNIFLIIIFFIMLTILGQKTSRFFLDIYIFAIFIFSMFINTNNNFINIYFKKLILLQSAIVSLILIYGVINLFPGSLNYKLQHNVLTKNGNGYSLFNWTNNELPKNARFITNKREIYFSNNYPIFTDFVFLVPFKNESEKNYMLSQIKKEKPEFILFYGKKKHTNYLSFDFKDCGLDLFSLAKGIGYHANRNPLNVNKEFYNGYIYSIDYKKLPGCVTEFN